MPNSVFSVSRRTSLAGQVLEELVVAHRPRTVGLALAVVEEDQVDVAGIVQLAAAELAHAQDDEAGRLAVRADGVAPLPAELSPGGAEGPFEDCVGQVGNLRRDRLQALLADDVAVGDPQRLAAFETPQRPQHRLLVLQGRDFRHQVLDEHLPGHRRPFGQPQQVEALRVGDQQVAEKCWLVEKIWISVGRAVASRSKSVPMLSGLRAWATKRSRLFSAMSGSGQRARMLAELIADHGQQIERHARRGHVDQGRVGAAEIDHPQALQELLRGVGVVEVVAKGGDIHAVKRRGKGHLGLQPINKTNSRNTPKMPSIVRHECESMYQSGGGDK